ncbi:hypothetical protein [Sphingomonas sp. 22R3R2A-7]|uniref:hypothetical protein n=1 Tax=Sphingomonas sp. 22R3R2A-7 TaxID=3050230 RepID=UPI002FE2588C
MGRRNPDDHKSGRELLGRVAVTHVQGLPKGGSALCLCRVSNARLFSRVAPPFQARRHRGERSETENAGITGRLGECRQPGSAPGDLEKLLCLRMTEITLNRPIGMSCSKDVYVEWMAEEAEQFVLLARMLMLEMRDGFSGHQRLLLGGSFTT